MTDFANVIFNSKASIEKEDLIVLLPLIEKIKPKHILEIGAWKGFSARVWLDAFSPEIFVTLEKDNRECEAWMGKKGCDSAYLYNTDSHLAETLIRVRGKFDYEDIDFLFIDGDHSFEGVKADFAMYGPLVREGGIVVFHDALYHADKTEEVDIFWNELKKHYKHKEIKESAKSTGIGVLYV